MHLMTGTLPQSQLVGFSFTWKAYSFLKWKYNKIREIKRKRILDFDVLHFVGKSEKEWWICQCLLSSIWSILFFNLSNLALPANDKRNNHLGHQKGKCTTQRRIERWKLKNTIDVVKNNSFALHMGKKKKNKCHTHLALEYPSGILSRL